MSKFKEIKEAFWGIKKDISIDLINLFYWISFWILIFSIFFPVIAEILKYQITGYGYIQETSLGFDVILLALLGGLISVIPKIVILRLFCEILKRVNQK